MKRTIGYISFSLLIILTLFMGWATWVEHNQGTEYAFIHFYRSFWFNILWAWLALTAGYYILQTGLFRRIPVLLLHLSFLVILTGALITRFNGKTGMIHLREGKAIHFFTCEETRGPLSLPFTLTLKEFRVEYYPGTSSPSNYVSIVVVKDMQSLKEFKQEISMNHILKYKGYRFYQSSFDEDMQGSILSVNHDPIGIVVTYSGYYLLFAAMIWVLVDKRGRFRKLLRQKNSL